MTLKLFEFQKHFTIDNFLIQLTQFEKTGSIGKIFTWLSNLVIFTFLNLKEKHIWSQSSLNFNGVFFYSAGKSENQIPLPKLEIDQVFSRHFRLQF